MRVIWRWAPFALALAANLWGVYAPSEPRGVGLFPDADKLAHLMIFAAVAWSAVRAGLPVRWVGLALALHAVESEIVQGTLLPSRDGDWRDATADLVGVALGVWVAIRSGQAAGRWRASPKRAGQRQ